MASKTKMKYMVIAATVSSAAFLTVPAGMLRDAVAQDYDACMRYCMEQSGATFPACHVQCRGLVIPDSDMSRPGVDGPNPNAMDPLMDPSQQ